MLHPVIIHEGEPSVVSRQMVYLDNHATTRTDPRVVAAMLPYFTEHYGNAASISHQFGWDAAAAVDEARQRVAQVIGAEPREIVFTSGATEANNLAIKGTAWARRRYGNHLITAASEHKAVLDPIRRLGREGWEVTILPCDKYGSVSPEAVAAAITPKTVLVSIMAANNEVGTLNPIAEIGRVCREREVVFHTDAAQAFGKIPTDVSADHIDLLSLSGHKLYAPKGIGALYVRRRDPQIRLQPLLDGGGHERGFRSGTVPVPLVVGLSVATQLAQAEQPAESQRLRELRECLHAGIRQRIPGVQLNGDAVNRLAGNLNLSFAHVDGEALMMHMREVAVSSGSACSAADPEPSHVLLAMGLSEDLARASLRFGLGRFTTREEIEVAIEAVSGAVERLRSQNLACTISDRI
jgi:cysteine desulfurase